MIIRNDKYKIWHGILIKVVNIKHTMVWHTLDFPGGSVGNKSACNAGDTEMYVQSLGWEDALEEGMATHSSILAWRIPWTEWRATVPRAAKSGHDCSD